MTDPAAEPAVRTGRRSAALLGFAAAGLLALVFVDSSRLVGHSFPGFLIWDNGSLIALDTASWTGRRAGLDLNRGHVVEVDGHPFIDGSTMLAEIAELEPGTPVRYTLRVRGLDHYFVVPVMTLTWSHYGAVFGIYLVIAAFFFSIALVALLLRPDLDSARALAGATFSIGFVLALSVDVLTTYRFVQVCQVAEAVAPVAIAHFALLFPVKRWDRARRRLVLGGLAAVLGAIFVTQLSVFRTTPELAHQLTLVVYGAMSLIPLLMLASFGQAFFRAAVPEQRLIAGLVLVNGGAAFLIPAALVIAFIFLDLSFSVGLIVLPLAIFPLSLLYAVVRHDLFEAEQFIRLSLGYGVATVALTLGSAVFLSLVSRLLSPDFATSPTAGLALLLAVGISFEPIRRRVQLAIDRVFFRSDLDAGRVLEECSADLASLSDEKAIANLVEQRLQDALNLEWVTLSRKLGPPPTTALSESIVFRGEQLGVLACGPKRSSAPFSAKERQLVRGIATQCAVAIRNARTISDLRSARESLLRNERLAAIGEFAGSVAHGIRNPLAGIRAAAQVALEQASTPDVRENLKGVISETDRLEQRVRTLLDFSRQFELQPRPVDVAQVLAAVCRVLEATARSQHVRITSSMPASPIEIVTDPDHLEEALLELAGNALHAMPEGGEIGLALEASAGGGCAISVSDTGVGIPADVQAEVFDLFFTTRPLGTGIGLAIVKKTIERLGGSVMLERSSAAGTTFRIELPAQG